MPECEELREANRVITRKLLVLTLFVAVGALTAYADTYSARGDFSTASNTNGVWTYGSSTVAGGAVTPYTVTVINGASCGCQQGWTTTGIPLDYINSSGANQSDGTVDMPTNVVQLHPG